MDFDIVLTRGTTGAWIADVPSLPGCHTQGRSRAEALEHVKEAIELYLDEAGPAEVPAVEFARVHVQR